MKEALERYPPLKENLLEILHDLQEDDPQHWLSDRTLRDVASYLGLTLSEIKGTAGFYSMFSFAPRGKHVIRICESPPCQLLGGTTVLESLTDTLKIKVGETTTDRSFTLETVSCLGMCGVAPAMMIDDEVYGNLTAERVVEIIAGMRRENETD